jgi:hypothetical protein
MVWAMWACPSRPLTTFTGIPSWMSRLPLLGSPHSSAARRNEVLGLKWPDIDWAKKRLHLNRGLVAVGYEVHQTRGKTRNARRSIASDDTTLAVLEGWRSFQAAEFAALGIANSEQWVFTDGDGDSVHPHAIYESFRRIVQTPASPGHGSTTFANTPGVVVRCTPGG